MPGMWDKDKEIGRRLDSVFSLGDYLVIYSVEPAGEVPTDLGTAKKTAIVAAALNSPEDRQEVSTLSSAIAAKAELATAADFPVVAQLLQVPSKKGNPALVLQFVREYSADATAAASVGADDDIPF